MQIASKPTSSSNQPASHPIVRTSRSRLILSCLGQVLVILDLYNHAKIGLVSLYRPIYMNIWIYEHMMCQTESTHVVCFKKVCFKMFIDVLILMYGTLVHASCSNSLWQDSPLGYTRNFDAVLINVLYVRSTKRVQSEYKASTKRVQSEYKSRAIFWSWGGHLVCRNVVLLRWGAEAQLHTCW
jgi:hypothetical protein